MFLTSESITPDEILSVGMDIGLHDDLLDVSQGRFLQPPWSVLSVRLDPDLGVPAVDRNGEQWVAGPDYSDKGEDQDSQGLIVRERFSSEIFLSNVHSPPGRRRRGRVCRTAGRPTAAQEPGNWTEILGWCWASSQPQSGHHYICNIGLLHFKQ